MPLPFSHLPCSRLWPGSHLVRIGLATAALALACGVRAEDEPFAAELRDLNQELLIAVPEAVPPYSYRDIDGTMKGFAIDVTAMVGEVMNLRLQPVTVPPAEMETALRSGRVDTIQFWAETPRRREWADFSVPIAQVNSVVVVRRDEKRIHTPADLGGMRVAVGQPGTVGDEYLRNVHPDAEPVYTATSEQFLRMLSAGGCDAAVMSRYTAHTMIVQFGLKNLRVLEEPVRDRAYDVRFCFAVRKGDSLLLARLNEGLSIVKRSEEYRRILRKWLGRYDRQSFTPEQAAGLTAGALALACGLATWAFLRQRTLSRRIARQATELAGQRSLLAALHEKHPLATAVLGFSGGAGARIVSLNPGAQQLFGLEAGAVGRPLDHIPLAPEWRAYLDEVIARSRAGTCTDRWEAPIATTRQVLQTIVVPLGADDTSEARLCVLAADVTKRRLIDQEIAQSRRLRALGELVGGIAHEFNNLLTPIIATTNLLQFDHAADKRTLSDLAVIDESANRAAELTRRLLAFGRKGDEQARPIIVTEAVASCFALLKPTVDRRVVWEMDAKASLPPILFNPTDLNQILFNLIINARDTLLEKLARSGGETWTPRLRVSVTERAGGTAPQPPESDDIPLAWQWITVEDNGLGIPRADVERLFEPFFTTKGVGQGMGLGLATVWRLVAEAGGTISVDSVPGQFSRFHVALPRRVEAAGPAAPTD